MSQSKIHHDINQNNMVMYNIKLYMLAAHVENVSRMPRTLVAGISRWRGPADSCGRRAGQAPGCRHSGAAYKMRAQGPAQPWWSTCLPNSPASLHLPQALLEPGTWNRRSSSVRHLSHAPCLQALGLDPRGLPVPRGPEATPIPWTCTVMLFAAPVKTVFSV